MRKLRRWITAGGRDLALRGAAVLPGPLVRGVCGAVRRMGARFPVVGRNVARNMAALGIDTDAARDYFRHIGDHLEDAMLLWRYARASSRAPSSRGGETGEAMPAGLREHVESRISLDASLDVVRAETDRGRGVVLMGPHICGFLVSMARLRQALPLTVYLRYSSDPRKRALKEQWCRVTGLDHVAEQTRPTDGLARMNRMCEIVQSGRVLYITPDLPQESGAGKPVRFFDREIYLPPGGPLLSLRSRAPLYLLLARRDGSAISMTASGPFEENTASRRGGRVQAGIAARLQWFADAFEQFLRREPALWYFWADKRWTKLLSGNPRYSRSLVDSPSPVEPSARPAEAH